MSATLEHATVVEIDHRGVLVRGHSGSGKTLLALELLSRCRAANIASALVADDYVYLSHGEASGSLRAAVPEGIEGRVELRGFGIATLAETRWKPQIDLALVVSLVPPAKAASPATRLTRSRKVARKASNIPAAKRAQSAPMPVGPHILWPVNAMKSQSQSATSVG